MEAAVEAADKAKAMEITITWTMADVDMTKEVAEVIDINIQGKQ